MYPALIGVIATCIAIPVIIFFLNKKDNADEKARDDADDAADAADAADRGSSIGSSIGSSRGSSRTDRQSSESLDIKGDRESEDSEGERTYSFGGGTKRRNKKRSNKKRSNKKRSNKKRSNKTM